MALFFDRCAWSHNLRIRKSETQCIVLTSAQYIELKLNSGEISRALAQSRVKERDWILGGNPETKASLSLFKDRAYVNIRVWDGSYPTKMGITLNAVEWTQLCSVLNETNPELKCCIKAYADIVRDRAIENWKRQCIGCETEDPSQRAHSCLAIPTGEAVDLYVSERGAEVHVRDIIVKAAIEAQKRGVTLHKPAEYVEVVKATMMEQALDRARTSQ